MRNIAWCIGVWKAEGGFEQAGHRVVEEPRVPEIHRAVLKSRLEASACDPATLDNVGVAVLLRCNEYQPPEL